MALKPCNIGLMIGRGDEDIAAWFNLLKEGGQSRSRWISALLVAYKNEEDIDIGSVYIPPVKQNEPPTSPNIDHIHTKSAPNLLFGVGNSQHQPTPPNQQITPVKFQYGWHIKGLRGEYIVGSVINVRISKKKAIMVINQVKESGERVATFVKILIRKHLRFEGENRLPDENKALEILLLHSIALETHVDSFNNAPPVEETQTSVSSTPAPTITLSAEKTEIVAEPKEPKASPNPLLSYI